MWGRGRGCPPPWSRALGANPKEPLGFNRIVSAMAPRIAPQQPPRRQHEAPQYAVLAHRLYRVARACRLILATPRQGWRDQALVDHHRSQHHRVRRAINPHEQRLRRYASPPVPTARSTRHRSPSGPRARPAHEPPVARPPPHRVPRSTRLARRRKLHAASASRDCARQPHRPCATPTNQAGVDRWTRWETSRARGDDWTQTDLDGTPARTPRCATDGGRGEVVQPSSCPRHYVDRRLRPLSRRRLSVSLPARVRIRARNPCVRARLRFFG